MWPGVPPRFGLPVMLLFAASFGWLLSAVHPHASAVWWGLAGLAAVLGAGRAIAHWRTDSRIADALAEPRRAGPDLVRDVDRIARQADDGGKAAVWFPPLMVLGLAANGMGAAEDRHDWLILVPTVGVGLYALLAVLLLRRRNRQVRDWLVVRPRDPGWRSVPPT